jgi:hypothetical protein
MEDGTFLECLLIIQMNLTEKIFQRVIIHIFIISFAPLPYL